MKEHRPTNSTLSSLGARQGLSTLVRNGNVTVWTACNAGHLQGVQDKGNTTLSTCALHRWALTSVDAVQHLPESRDGTEHQHRNEGCHHSLLSHAKQCRLLHSCTLWQISPLDSCWLFPAQPPVCHSHVTRCCGQ